MCIDYILKLFNYNFKLAKTKLVLNLIVKLKPTLDMLKYGLVDNCEITTYNYNSYF